MYYSSEIRVIRITIKIKMKSVVIKMSFSSELKTELSKINNLKNKNEVVIKQLIVSELMMKISTLEAVRKRRL